MTPHRAPEDARWLVLSVLDGVQPRGVFGTVVRDWLGVKRPPCQYGWRLLDAGCGDGVVAMGMMKGLPGVIGEATLLDNDPAMVALAHQALVRAGWCDHARAVCHDVVTWVPPAPYDLIVTNPPYRLTSRGHTAALPRKRHAHTISPPQLAAWFGALRGMLAEGGVLAAVLHPDCLPVLAPVMRGMDAVLWPLQTHPERAPKRVIAHWCEGAGNVLVRPPVQVWEAEVRRWLGI
jgi:tRNA1(Val) A37 N6-methylase TrmN6